MKATWLGQAGLLFDFDGTKVMIDPYLSNSVAKINSANNRRIEVNEYYFNIKPDILVLTHDHLDHTDPETLDRIFEKFDNICVLASANAWKRVRNYGGNSNYVMFNKNTVWTQDNIRFQAISAEHSDDNAIGLLITYKQKNYYITGDTLYNKTIIESIDVEPDVLFIPINGVGNNMNMIDAWQFAKNVKAKRVVPLHYAMFDNIDPLLFNCENKVIMEIYKEIDL